MTLMELLVVLAIIGVVLGAAGYGLSAITRADLRRSAGEIAAAVKFLWAEAASTGRAHRLVLDLDENKVSAEVADGRFLLKNRDKVPGRDDEHPEDAVAGEGPADGADAPASPAPAMPGGMPATPAGGGGGGLGVLGSLFGGVEGNGLAESGRAPRFPKPAFSTFEGMSALKPHALPSDVKVTLVFAEHMTEPARAGKAELYFWPGGMTERAVVELRSGESVFTVYVPPVTGKAKVISGEMALPDDMRHFEAPDEEVVE
jgi:prepilin-type N-terminal cleavage/methylation domain-containing protein